MRAIVSTDPYKGAEAFDFWRTTGFRWVDARRTAPVPDAGFRGMAAFVSVGGVDFWRYRSGAIETSRTATHCRADGGDEFNLTLLRSGRAVVEQNGTTVIGAGDIGLFDMGRPLQARWDDHSEILIRIPRATARRVLGDLGSLAGLRIPGDAGVGRVLAAQMRLTDRLVDQLDPVAAAAAVDVVLKVAAQAVAMIRRGDGGRGAAPAVRPGRADAIEGYIDRHLDDPDLDVASIATALGLSRSSLYRAFPVKDGGPARFILNRRLDLCREALLSGASTESLGDLAARWGFDDYGVFLRAFRRRFGAAPSALRAK